LHPPARVTGAASPQVGGRGLAMSASLPARSASVHQP
jgi:hypothetical protein